MRMRVRRTVGLLLAPVVGAVLLSLAGCSDDASSVSDGKDLDEVMALAKQHLDETSGVSFTLEADALPDGVSAISAAEGVGTHAPAFEGTITVNLLGQAVEVPVVAVDDKVWAQLPFTSGYQDIDPTEYGAPDPAALITPDQGFSAVLGATEDLERGESVRGGEDNKEVLTEYTGTVSGDTMTNVIPTASGEFDAVYTITDDDELRSASFTGVFYPDSESMTYTVTFDDYGTEQEIIKP